MTPAVHSRPESGTVGPLAIATGLFIAGQAVLILLAPLSRATTAVSIYNGTIFLSPDSYGYLDNGATWAGVGSETWNRWGFLVVIRVGEYLGSGPVFLVTMQALLLTVAGAASFDLGRRYSGTLAGFVAASAVLLNPMVAQWVRFVHTEIIFYALALLSVWAADRVLSGRGGEPALVGIAIAVAFVRPNGVFVAAAGFTALMLHHVRAPLRGIAVLLVWGASVGALVMGLNDATPRYEWDTAAYTVGGVVIEGAAHARTAIEMPPPDSPVGSNAELVGYAVEHPIAVGRLALLRIWTETIQVRRHYPDVVNLGVGLVMFGYVAMAVVGLVLLRRTGLTMAALLVAVPLALLVGVTFAVPEGRFGWAYLVAFAPHAGVGAARSLQAGCVLIDRVSRAPSG